VDSSIAQILDRFKPLCLAELNARAAMLERLDNKYIVPAARFRPALEAFAEHFDVLEIDGKRAFTYATRYFDDENLRTYHAHHQGRRKRCKVRIREYVDAGISFLEVKLKDRRKLTVKRRLKIKAPMACLDQSCIDFVEHCHSALYDQPLGLVLRQVISMRYRRITLVAKAGGERMTIDSGLNFQAEGSLREIPGGLFILETKSPRGNGIADRVLRGLRLHPTAQCSKYCIGMAALDLVERRNRFLPALKRLELNTDPSHAA